MKLRISYNGDDMYADNMKDAIELIEENLYGCGGVNDDSSIVVEKVNDDDEVLAEYAVEWKAKIVPVD